MQITQTEVKEKADELVKLTLQAQEVKSRIDKLKSFFEQSAVEALKDTKLKSVDFWGSQNSRITVSNSETVKIASAYMLIQVLGGVATDFIKEETTFKLTEPFKRLLCAVCQGNYTVANFEDTLKNISPDENIQGTLKKKLKGNFEKDKSILIAVAELSEENASDWAYLISEVINYNRLSRVLESAKWNGRFEDAVKILETAVIVDEGVKVTVVSES